MTPDLLSLARRGPAGVLTMTRSEKRNALSRAMVAALARGLGEAVRDPAVRVVVLAAAGPAFCAGLDLDELAEVMQLADARERMHQDSRQLAALYRGLATCPKPTIAAVRGPAVAGGAGLVTACDLAIATPSARFGYPEVRRGIMPAIITPLLLRVVSPRAARYLLLTGNLVDAAEAARLGVYNAVVPTGDLDATVDRWCADLSLGAPATLTGTKQWIDRVTAGEELWIESADASALGRFTDECAEGLAAFREKRSPGWVPPDVQAR